ncbi:Uma2 family endonuclease [Streptacidiphilus sp. EB129]|uniref:Uma2 family endonuclease n=1 Tax=Streptacidiphilus sp. EB129 TaxID=3156262 RepID=UPI003513678A
MTNPDFTHLLRIAEELRENPPPLIGKIEISRGEIVMMMSPSTRHGFNANRVQVQLIHQIPDELIAAAEPDITDPVHGIRRTPDVAVVDAEALKADEKALSAHAVHAVFEIVSPSNPENDHKDKVVDYAQMRIPIYVIIDPRDGTVLVHDGLSEAGHYDGLQSHRFGDTVRVGPWTLRTDGLEPYGPTVMAGYPKP